MAGDHEEADEYPIGFRFKPKEEELVEYYLVPMLMRQPIVPNDWITDCNVYSSHPDTLTKIHKGVDQEEWYFLSPRSRYENSARPARKTQDRRGRWKASTASKEVEQKVVCNGITFCRSVLNYFEGVPKNEVRTKWIMLELKVPCFEIKRDKAGPKDKKLDEYVVCKIYVSPQHKRRGDADEEGTSSACEGDEEACSPTKHGQGTAASILSDKQAGKRPMLEKVRPGSLGIASTQASCSISNAPRTGVYSSGAPGQLSGAYTSQAPQMPQRQAGAFDGQSPLVQHQPAQQTPALYHRSFTDARHHPFGQTTATMTTTRPPPALENPPRRDPAGTAFRPQVSLQCYYDQNYRGVRPPGNASSPQPQMLAPSSFLPRQQPLPPQRPFFNGDANHRAAAAGPGGTPYGGYPDQSRSLTSEAAGHDGAADGRNGAARCLNVNDEQYFVELATTTSNPCLMTGTRTQTAPAPPLLMESQEPPAAGAVEVATERRAKRLV